MLVLLDISVKQSSTVLFTLGSEKGPRGHDGTVAREVRAAGESPGS